MLRKVVTSVLFLLAVAITMFLFLSLGKNQMEMNHEKITVWTSSDSITSFDPLLYDYFKHHPVQSLLNCTLTSLYRGSGEATPELASSWRIENGGSKWSFLIRDDIYFSNGLKVTPEIVQASLKRIFFLFLQNETKYYFINQLKGVENFKTLNGNLPGIVVEGKNIVFSFREPVPRFNEIISFGHFGIVDPNHFDPTTGKWLLKKFSDFNGCGPYEYSEHTNASMMLKKKIQYPLDLSNKTGFSKIEFVFSISESNPADILLGGPSEVSPLNKTHRFVANGGRSITYFRVFPWKDKKSAWSNKDFRRHVRNTIYQNYEIKKINFTRSLFPLVLSGVSEPHDRDGPISRIDKGEKVTFRFNDPYPENHTGPVTDRYSGLMESLRDLNLEVVSKRKLTIEDLVAHADQPTKSLDLDVGSMWTSISLEDPESDVRLMFSKEGISLPDPTGKISEELKKSKINIQFINQQLFDDAIIWPLSITNRGFWARKDLDLSDYNTLKPLGELQWIGRK